MIVPVLLFVIAYAALLITGHAVLLPVVLLAAVFLFRGMMCIDRRLEPFAAVLVLFAAQNVAAGMLGGTHAEASLKAAVLLSALLPACLVLAAWTVSPWRAWRWLSIEIRGAELWLLVIAFAYTALVLARWFTGPFALSVSISALRNALTPAYGILVVLLLPPELRPTIEEIVSFLRRWGVLIALFGFVEITVLGDRFWSGFAHIGAAIHVKELSVARRSGPTVPADFYTYFGHHYFRRLVSLYGDAITTGYYLAVAFLAAVIGPSRRGLRAFGLRSVWVVVLAAALGLSFVKGGFQIVAVGVVVALLLHTWLRSVFERGALVVLLACALCAIGAQATGLMSQSSVQLHVSGLTSAVHAVTDHVGSSLAWGKGIGTAGADSVYIQRHAGQLVPARETPGLDNGAGTILVSTGALGLAGVLALFALLIPTCARRARKNRASAVAAVATVALLVNFLLQEHALTLVPSFPFWVLAAIGFGAAGTQPTAKPTVISLVPAARPGWRPMVRTRVPIAGFDPRAAHQRRKNSGVRRRREPLPAGR